jgi:hypothetical protein
VGGAACFGVLDGCDATDGFAAAVARVAAAAVLAAAGTTSKGAHVGVTVPALQLLGAALRDRRLDDHLLAPSGSGTLAGSGSGSGGGSGGGASAWARLAGAGALLLRAGDAEVERAAAELLRALATASGDAAGAAAAARAQTGGPRALCRLAPGFAVAFTVDGTYGFGHDEGFARRGEADRIDDLEVLHK